MYLSQRKHTEILIRGNELVSYIEGTNY